VEGAGGTEGAVLVSGRGSTLVDEESGLEVEAGELFAVACAEPAEADLLAERLARFEDSGRPMLGDVPLREMPLRQVRERILLARNSDKFFNGGLRSELDPTGRRADEEIRTAIRVASAQDILDALPEGLDTEMTDGGREFSGGQLQRLRLVRALLARREVTVLVEPTSAVDAHTEARIAVRLAESHAPATRGAALVAVHAGTVVAMKVSSLSSHVAAVGIEAEPQTTTILFTTSPLLLDSAHRVAYVEDGRVVAVGTHRELLASEPRYAAVVTRGEDIEEAA
jgi:ABC-type multidrug transport system fused ATPase/permease subunit